MQEFESGLASVSAALALGLTISTGAALAHDGGADVQGSSAKKEKCYGVVAKGMNDCATAAHSCAGQSSEDAHPEEWVYVPAGLCDRLSGGASEHKKKGE